MAKLTKRDFLPFLQLLTHIRKFQVSSSFKVRFPKFSRIFSGVPTFSYMAFVGQPLIDKGSSSNCADNCPLKAAQVYTVYGENDMFTHSPTNAI